MKELKLIDRVVVEIKDADVDDCTNEYVASVLRSIADRIVAGMKGGRYSPNEGFEVLWEHECPNYGSFRMGDKSLISMHYYNSEPKPKVISDELMDSIVEFNKDYDEQGEKIGEDIYTKTDFLEDAARLLSRVEQENK